MQSHATAPRVLPPWVWGPILAIGAWGCSGADGAAGPAAAPGAAAATRSASVLSPAEPGDSTVASGQVASGASSACADLRRAHERAFAEGDYTDCAPHERPSRALIEHTFACAAWRFPVWTVPRTSTATAART